jgi:branched-chain amino acid transport system ATP-binding protein
MLSVEGLVSRYGRIEVLHNVTFTIGPQEIVALVGSNGAGKSTLLRALSGVQPIVSGSIILNGDSIHGVAAHRRVAGGLAHVPQGRQVFAPLSVEDNLLLGGWSLKSGRASELERIYAFFPILAEFRWQMAGSLSGGQQQILAIGRAMMSRPKVLLLDEPSMGLAPLLVQTIFAIFEDIRRSGVSVLVVEQAVQSVLRIADRGYVLEMGYVTMEGTGRELLADARIQAAYLGV